MVESSQVVVVDGRVNSKGVQNLKKEKKKQARSTSVLIVNRVQYQNHLFL